jgi:hypothetical protein
MKFILASVARVSYHRYILAGENLMTARLNINDPEITSSDVTAGITVMPLGAGAPLAGPAAPVPGGSG